MAYCQVTPNADAFASGMIAFLDCQSQVLGAGGYAALAADGSSVSLMIGALVTIFVALIGYRLLFGEAPTVREGVVGVAKIGLVLALATNWPAYQVLVYDVVLRAPAELAAAIASPGGLPGADGGLPLRLDGADRALRTLSVYGVGLVPFQDNTIDPLRAPPLFAGFDTFALGAARVIFLGGALGAFAFLRIGAGLLLALGPLFLAFLLFDATRGLFEGWLRALIGIALASVATAIVLGVELALIEPWLTALITQRAGGAPIPGIPVPLLATTAIFAGLLTTLMVLTGRIAAGLRLPYWRAGNRNTRKAGAAEASISHGAGNDRVHSIDVSAPGNARSRAAAIADSVAAMRARSEQVMLPGNDGSTSPSGAARSSASGPVPGSSPTPLGQGGRRRLVRRVSASSGARDRMA